MNKYYISYWWSAKRGTGPGSVIQRMGMISEKCLDNIRQEIKDELNYDNVVITNWKKLDE